MSFLHNLELHGMNAFMVKVEAGLSNGLPSFEVVGLPDAAVRESRDRVRAVLKNCGFTYPVSRITVSLTPADRRKEGPIYDLSVLAALLYASGQLEGDAEHCTMMGKLSLSDEVWPVKGILSMALAARQAGIADFFVPAENAPRGAVMEGLQAYPVTNIRSLVMHLTGQRLIPPCVSDPLSDKSTAFPLPDSSEVRGREVTKRALEIAASRSHSVLLISPPGSGKNMLTKRVPSTLPDITLEEAITTTQTYSVASTLPGGNTLTWEQPFRAPHRTISPAGLSGGGAVVCPGEVSLARNGVPFLGELPEFRYDTMEVLYQPLEDGTVTISRVGGGVTYPSSIMLAAAMNPYPCGCFGRPTRACVCSSSAVDRYLGRISGPFLDRLDLHVKVPLVGFNVLSPSNKAESSVRIRERVNAVREHQNQRFHDTGIACNTRIMPSLLHEVCRLSPGAQTLLKTTFEHIGLSARAFDQVLKIPRTIADPDSCGTIEPRHAAETVQYRALDRKYQSAP